MYGPAIGPWRCDIPSLGEGWAAAVKGGIDGSLQELNAQRKAYLAYLAERSKATTPPDAYQELVELTDRGLMSPEDVVLDTFTLQAEYTSAFQQTIGGTGGVSVAIGPATISASGSLQQQSSSNANLRLSATFKTRPRAEFLALSQQSLPPRPVAEASGTPKP